MPRRCYVFPVQSTCRGPWRASLCEMERADKPPVSFGFNTAVLCGSGTQLAESRDEGGGAGKAGGAVRDHVTNQPPAEGGAERVLRSARERPGAARFGLVAADPGCRAALGEFSRGTVAPRRKSLWLRSGERAERRWWRQAPHLPRAQARFLRGPRCCAPWQIAVLWKRRPRLPHARPAELRSSARFRAEPDDPAVVGFFPVALAHFKGGGGDFGELRGRSLKERVQPWPFQLADCKSQGCSGRVSTCI